MARKLNDVPDSDDADSNGGLGRRDYVRAGMLSTIAGVGLVGSSTTAAAETHSVHVVGGDALATYELTVSGRLEPDSNTDSTMENVSGRNAEGTVRGGIHAYRFEGELLDVRLDGDAEIRRNGDPVDRSVIESQ